VRAYHCKTPFLLFAFLFNSLPQSAICGLPFTFKLHQPWNSLLSVEQVSRLYCPVRPYGRWWGLLSFIKHQRNLHFGTKGIKHFRVLYSNYSGLWRVAFVLSYKKVPKLFMQVAIKIELIRGLQVLLDWVNLSLISKLHSLAAGGSVEAMNNQKWCIGSIEISIRELGSSIHVKGGFVLPVEDSEGSPRLLVNITIVFMQHSSFNMFIGHLACLRIIISIQTKSASSISKSHSAPPSFDSSSYSLQ
jgi:hypothetical protein